MVTETKESIDYQPYLPQLIPELPLKELPQFPLSTIAEEIADRLANMTQQKFPVDADLLARYCCVVRIIYKNRIDLGNPQAAIEKITGESGCYYLVKIIEDLRLDRTGEQRFAIGHEIGHIIAEKIKPLLNRAFADYREKEGFCDTFARMLLLPRTLLLQELKRIRDIDLHRQCVEISNKSNVPPEFVCKRIVEDLKLFKGIFLVIPYGNSAASWIKNLDRWSSSNYPPNIFLPDNALKGLLNLIERAVRHHGRWPMNEVLSVDCKPVGVKNPKKPNWRNVYRIDVKTFFAGDDEGVERAICSIRFGDKIAEVRDDYGGEYVCL